MVSMPCLHFFRWAEQLQDSGHEIYWFDVTDGGKKVKRIHWVNQIVGWKFRWNYPGRTFIKINFPRLYDFIQRFNERDIKKIFERHLLEIQPEVVHSFALYISCTPILQVMNKNQNIKWIYSSWGSDLYDLQNHSKYLIDIQNVLKRVDYLFTDCIRDYKIAQQHGFENDFLGVLPGGGGYHLSEMEAKIKAKEIRSTILIKGFQGKWGRAINVLKALEGIKDKLNLYTIVVFGADNKVVSFCENSELSKWMNFSVLCRVTQDEVFNLMAKSFLLIGNSVSDGMPNTMLEAMCMKVFPIQSNPGGVTQELIKDGFNGFLIEDTEDVEGISQIILRALNDSELIKKGIVHNSLNIIPNLDYDIVKKKVLQSYLSVLQDN
ncbi:glycosyltransferase family 1 [Flavobacterium seoulense]|uniref:Glycosyltransferase family 1 n=2 Tax=Flavobacterium seoulense TaxID=1492738 RepID=A0A066WJI0_9FLAO|nr:glycosyltransferase family 1 [Flavobacterium seoulense]